MASSSRSDIAGCMAFAAAICTGHLRKSDRHKRGVKIEIRAYYQGEFWGCGGAKGGGHGKSSGANGRFIFSDEGGGDCETSWAGAEGGGEWRRFVSAAGDRAKVGDRRSECPQPAYCGDREGTCWKKWRARGRLSHFGSA